MSRESSQHLCQHPWPPWTLEFGASLGVFGFFFCFSVVFCVRGVRWKADADSSTHLHVVCILRRGHGRRRRRRRRPVATSRRFSPARRTAKEKPKSQFKVHFPSTLLGFTGFHLGLPSFTEFYWVLPGFTGFYLVILGFTEFYRVLLIFH